MWPFDFVHPNGVSWLSDRKGIHFSSPGVLTSVSQLRPQMSLKGTSLTIEGFFRTDEMWSLRSLLGFYSPDKSRRLLIFQWDGGLLVSRGLPNELKATTTDQIYAKGIFERGRPMLLAIASGPAGTAIYANGIQKEFFPNFQIYAADLCGELVLGTSPAKFSPWVGDFYRLTISARTLSPKEVSDRYESLSAPSSAVNSNLSSTIAEYLFSESTGNIVHSSIPSAPDLQIPRTFSVPHKGFLASPSENFRNTWAYYRDALSNILGFMPLGFLLCAYLAQTRASRFAVLYSYLAGGLFSFVIEFTQGYIPQRDSGFNDVITNGLGALLGALLARRLHSLAARTANGH